MTSSASDRNILILLGLILLVPLAVTVLFTLDNPPAAIVPTATIKPTLKPTLPTLTASPMLTAVNITPTQEWVCKLTEEAGLYTDTALTDLIVLLPEGTDVLPTNDFTDTVVWVVNADGLRLEGYTPWKVLGDDCH